MPKATARSLRREGASKPVDGLPYGYESFEQGLEQVEAQHVGSVGFGFVRFGVCLHEQSVGSGGDACAGYGLDELRHTSGDSGCLVGLLQGVCDVEYYGVSECLHFGDAAVVDNEVVIAECGTSLGDGYFIVAGVYDFLCCEFHGFGGKELSFFYVYSLSGLCSGYEQVGLPAEEGRYLEYVYVFGSDGCFGSGVYVGHYGDIECLAYATQDTEGFFVADSGEGVDARAVCLAVRAFEYVGYIEPPGYLDDVLGYVECHVFAFDDAWAG